jgi:regulator of replication initiation timing
MCSDVFLFYPSYEKTTEELQEQLDDVDKKIHTQTKENQKLDMEAASLSVVVNEQQLLQDLKLESRQTEAAKQR